MRTVYCTGLLILFWLMTAGSSHAQQWSAGAEYVKVPVPTAAEPGGRLDPLTALHELNFSPETFAESNQISRETYWHRFSFPATEKDESLVLSLSNYMIDELDFYLIQDGRLTKHWQRGDTQDWDPEVRYSGIWFEIERAAGQPTELLVRKRSDGPLLFPFRLLEPGEYRAVTERRFRLWGAAAGALVILLLHNIVVFLLARYPAYGLYTIFHVSVFLSIGVTQGFGPWFWPMAFNQWLAANILTLYTLSAWSIYSFTYLFLQLYERVPQWRHYHRPAHVFFALALAASLLLPEYLYATPFVVIQGTLSVLCIVWAIKAIKQGFAPAALYLASWSLFIIGAMVGSLIFHGSLPFNTVTEYTLVVSTVIQLLGFTLSLAFRARHLEQEKNLQMMTSPVSGLPNRTYFLNELVPQGNSRSKSDKVTLILIHLAGLHDLSKAVGPGKTQQATGLLAQRLNQTLLAIPGIQEHRLPNGTKASIIDMGQDHLLFLCRNISKVSSVIRTIEPALNKTIRLDELEFKQLFSIGVAHTVEAELDLITLYQKAQMAADENWRSSALWSEYQAGLMQHQRQQLQLVAALSATIHAANFQFLIQPKVELATRRITSGELLLRWHHPELGQVPPDVFITLAEQVGLIFKLTSVVMQLAFRWVKAHEADLGDTTLALNISARDLLQANFATEAIALCTTEGVAPSRFVLEITETTAIGDKAIAVENADQLRAAGFGISIDDFGAGYSSMQNINRLSPNEIKIDRLFVSDLATNVTHSTLCRSLIRLSLDLQTCATAEGIETAEQLAMLEAWGCQSGQGYYLFRPQPPEDYLDLLRAQASTQPATSG
ncbi:EAL domain-containing protein [Salinispirillum sp. LH 10-3-1]|uniref:EAL domain-containing protein n=1 Tax=Salinispirillum sp. LH 10-3-1 TaxID=2952525 RepID=A0AB38YH98_9GAMM